MVYFRRLAVHRYVTKSEAQLTYFRDPVTERCSFERLSPRRHRNRRSGPKPPKMDDYPLVGHIDW
jgi:hypothetical protein